MKLAAVKALNNALEFASRNFDVDTERNYILQVICEACTHGSDEVKEYAYQCLSRIAEVCILQFFTKSDSADWFHCLSDDKVIDLF